METTESKWMESCKLLEQRLNHDYEEIRSAALNDRNVGEEELKRASKQAMDIFLRVEKGKPPINRRKDLGSRVAVPLGNGYIAKTPLPQSHLRSSYFGFANSLFDTRYEEENCKILQEELGPKGFIIPDHKVVGVRCIEGKIVVDPNGTEWVLTKDMSDKNRCQVSDVLPHYFVTLANKGPLLGDYQRYLEALSGLYHSGKYEVSVKRHGSPKDPTLALSRMICCQIDQCHGTVFFGDLDNLVFDRKKT